jgi:GxxExxY protein
VSGVVLDCGLKVHRALGPGLLESAYEHCLAREFELRGLNFERQVAVPLVYEGTRVEASFRLDFVVGETIVVEIKSVERMLPLHGAQVRTYLKFSAYKVGLLMNFNTVLFRDGVRRIIA